jgi:hypothetical protein
VNLGHVILLCNITMTMAEPWANAGYHVIMVDPQHPKGINTQGNITKIGATVLEAMPYLGKVIRGGAGCICSFFSAMHGCCIVWHQALGCKGQGGSIFSGKGCNRG